MTQTTHPLPSNIFEKLLTHRVRGFGAYEHSPSGFAAACGSDVKYIEIDSRASSDGCLYVYHNPKTGREVNKTVSFARTPHSTLSELRFSNGEPLLTLERAVDVFASGSAEGQFLCIDIKDYGFENEHLSLVREYGIESKTIFVSWIPQVLLTLAALDSVCPLIMSHWNVSNFGAGGKALVRFLENRCFSLAHFVIFGKALCDSRIDDYRQGYQHAMICQDLGHRLTKVLSSSSGGICVHKSMVHPRLTHYCAEKNLRLWVFSATETNSFLEIAGNQSVDVVFSDNAPAVIRHLRENAQNIG